MGPLPCSAAEQAADKLEALQRENAELRAERDKAIATIHAIKTRYETGDKFRAETAEARVEDLSRQLAEVENDRDRYVEGHVLYQQKLETAERQLAEVRAEVARVHLDLRAAECLQDSQYKAGVGAGWNFAIRDDEAGFQAALASTEHIAELKRIKQARAALSGSDDSGWRSMESAPKDGTEILAAHDKAAIVVYWQEDRTVDGAPGWADGETDLDGYFHTYNVFVWQPLPPLPAAPAPAGGTK
jgi:hypothetical protein